MAQIRLRTGQIVTPAVHMCLLEARQDGVIAAWLLATLNGNERAQLAQALKAEGIECVGVEIKA